MAREREKKISRITKGHAWLSIVFYFIAYHVVTLLLIAVLAIVFYNILFAKVNGQYSSIEYLANMYQEAERLGDANTLKILDADDRPFFVRDINGKIIYQKGKITCSNEGVDLGMPLFGRKIFVYTDTENDYFDKGLWGFVGIRLDGGDTADEGSALAEAVKEHEEHIKEALGEDEDLNVKSGEEILRDISVSKPGFGLLNMEDMADSIPVWLPVRISRGQTLVAKVTIGMDVDDMELIVALVEAFILINLLIFVILVFSVIKSIRRQKEITNLLFMDDDTDGNNWLWFLVYAEKLLCKRRNAGRRYALVNLYFVKYRNYCMIHSLEAGKRALWKVYHTLGGYLGKSALIAHVTSSSFALLMEFTDEAQLKSQLDGVIKELEKTGNDHKFRFQAGVAIIDVSVRRGRIRKRKSVNLEKEYNDACTARETMELSGESGIVIYDDRLMEEQKWVDIVTEHQEKALKNEEFVVYYQPKYSPDTNELRGAEALIRWQSPEFGFVSPGRIIPIFEKNGFITEIDHYMISHVARDQKEWIKAGYTCVPISVNVSRAHFIENDLAEQIRDMVDEAGAPRDMIEIELTESAFFDDKNALINTINRLKSYGFSVSMDDFGAGYSSLNSLKDMALDVLKLDAEFFRGDADSERKEIVVAEAIRLAKSLNMRTVAEGVEEKEQVDFLAKQGCDMIQGFYFAKPMPGEEYEERMRKNMEEMHAKAAAEKAQAEDEASKVD
ncbi:MAG: EAL domain-containing protein [Lachnospiraceae bacterium]|nr:EAL domain-containing protein [Lachnospiraceae bacterium]